VWFSGNHFPNFHVFVIIRKVGQQKILSSQKKIGLVSRKVFSFYFGRKTLFRSCEKFRNVILFTDYIKFGPQTFDCYIYIVLNNFFSILFFIILFLY
jgi:hypothetical protein